MGGAAGSKHRLSWSRGLEVWGLLMLWGPCLVLLHGKWAQPSCRDLGFLSSSQPWSPIPHPPCGDGSENGEASLSEGKDPGVSH